MSDWVPDGVQALSCSKCGGKACICCDDELWAAHCRICSQSIGKQGFYDPCCKSKDEAIAAWNKLNTL